MDNGKNIDNLTTPNSRLIQFLDASVNGDLDNAKKLMDSNNQKLTTVPVARRLDSVATGDTSICYVKPFYILGNYSPSLLDNCNKAVDYLNKQGVQINTILVIDAEVTLKEFAAAVPLESNVFYLCLSSRDERQLYASTVHELVHTIFKSGNRFLNEAAAYYFELMSKQEFPDQAHKEAAVFNSLFIDVLALLAYEGKDDPYFEHILPKGGFVVHALGALFFRYLIEQKGIAEVLDLYQKLEKDTSNSSRINTITDWLGQDLLCIKNLLPVADEGYESRVAKESFEYAEVEAAFVLGQLTKLQYYYDIILANHANNTKYPARIANESDILVLASVAIDRSFRSELSRGEKAFCCSRIENFLLEKGEAWPRFRFYKVILTLLDLPFEGSMLDAMLLIDQAKIQVQRELTLNPLDPVCLVFQSRLIWYSPSETTDDKKEAITLLHRLENHQTYSEPIMHLIAGMKSELAKESM